MIDDYIRAGWVLVPIPPGSKAPRTAKWNDRGMMLRSAADLPPGWGVGLAHAYSGTMALDIDDYEASKTALALVGIDLDALFAAPDAVTIDSGRAGHGKLLYAMPFGLVLPGKQITANRAAVYDLRCGTAAGLTVQDVLPPSIHPQTGQPYRWGGRGQWQHLPMIPMPLLDLWQALLAEPTSTAPATPTDWEEVRSALAAIDPSCSRDEWIAVGMALHSADPERGLTLWTEWSKGSASKWCGEREILTQWRSFREDKPALVGMGTLFKLAQDAGWTRPPPDAATLFASVIPQDPAFFLDALKAPVPRVDIDLFPPVLAQRAKQLSEFIGLDPVVPLYAGLGAICAAADARSRLQLAHGYTVPPLLWLMTIGDPADKKSPGADPMISPLAGIEAEDRPRYAKAMQDWEVREAIWAAAKKSMLDWAKSPEAALGLDQPEVGECPPPPVPLRFTVQDVTSQKLVRMCADRPRGVLCYLDEMSSWAKKLGDSHSGEDRSAWTKSHDCKRYEMDRVGAGSIVADPMAVAIYGNIQPRVFRENITNLSTDGLLQRFLPAILDGRYTRKPKPPTGATPEEAAWEMTLRTVYALPVQTYTLSPEAAVIYDQFQDWYDQRRRDERLLLSDDTFREALGKSEGQCGRMALVFHLIEAPFSSVISGDTMRRACTFYREYVIPAQWYALTELSGAAALDGWLRDWIIMHADDKVVTLSEIKRAAVRQLTRMQATAPYAGDQVVLSAMRNIEAAGWAARIDDGLQEHRHVAQWMINPDIMQRFAAYRGECIAARERQLDHIYRAAKTPRTRRAHGWQAP